MFWSCCGLGRRRERQDQHPDERTRLLDAPSTDLPFLPVQQTENAIDDEALIAYRRRLDKILEETAEKFISVNATGPTHPPLTHIRSNTSSASTSGSASGTASGSGSRKNSRGQQNNLTSPAVRDSTSFPSEALPHDTLWRAERKEPGNKGSVHSMQKVKSSKKGGNHAGSAKARGKAAAQMPLDSLSNGHSGPSEDAEEQGHVSGEYDTITSYKTARDGEYDEDADEDADDNDTAEEETASGASTPTGGSIARRQQQSKGTKRTPVQDIFNSANSTGNTDTGHAKVHAHQHLQKALAMSDEDFANLLTQG